LQLHLALIAVAWGSNVVGRVVAAAGLEPALRFPRSRF